MMRLNIVLVAVLLTQKSLALEVYQGSSAGKVSEWTFFYNEDKKWIVESVALDSAGWPKLESRNVYVDSDEARVQLSGERSYKNLERLKSLPETPKALRGRPGQMLWKVTNEWSWDWELKYSEWVKKELSRGWWKEHGLATDCADVAYSAKWIFARNNGLPMANRLASGHWFTHESVKPEWANLPTASEWHKDQRFLAGLNYMLDFVFTHSLWRDSYPIAITAESLIPGAHHLAIYEGTGHTQLVHKVGTLPDEIPVITLSSTVPRSQRALAEQIFFVPNSEINSSGFLRIRWPKRMHGHPELVDAQDMPHFSNDQFAHDFIQAPRTEFWQEVFHRINPNADFDLIAQKTANQILALLQERLQVVDDGFRICSLNKCVEGSADWDAWSTPSRDARISATIKIFSDLQQFVTQLDSINRVLQTPVLIQEGHTFTMRMLMTGFDYYLFSSDPNEDPVLRWGVHPRATAEKMRRMYESGLTLRDTEINKNHLCRGISCLFGSPEHNSASSFELDARFWSAAGRVSRYCDSFGEPFCGELSQLLKSISVTVRGQTLSVWQWIQDSFFFNSDARHDADRRYSSFSKETAHLVMEPEELVGFVSYRSQLVLTNEAGDKKLLMVQGADLVPWPVPLGETVENLDSHSGWVWTKMGDFVLARKDAGDVPLRFMLPTAAERTIANAGTLVVSDGRQGHVLRIENGTIRELHQLPLMDFYLRQGELVIASSASNYDLLIDMSDGSIRSLPEPGSFVQNVTRFGDSYLVKFASISKDRIMCQVIGADSRVTDLTPIGNCIHFSPSQDVGIFELNGRAVLRTFRSGGIVKEEDVGEIEGSYPSFIRLQNGSQTRYFCFGFNRLSELRRSPGAGEPMNCNDRYLIEQAGRTWQVRDIAAGSIVLQAEARLSFASDRASESHVIAMSGGSYRALMDLERPERFALLTDELIRSTFSEYGDSSGLVVIKGGRMVWLAE